MMSEMNMGKELAALERMTPGQLREKYRELFGDESRSGLSGDTIGFLAD